MSLLFLGVKVSVSEIRSLRSGLPFWAFRLTTRETAALSRCVVGLFRLVAVSSEGDPDLEGEMRLLGRESVVGSTEAIGLVARRCFFCDNRCALPLPSCAPSSSMISRFLLCPASPSSTSMVEGESCCGRELTPEAPACTLRVGGVINTGRAGLLCWAESEEELIIEESLPSAAEMPPPKPEGLLKKAGASSAGIGRSEKVLREIGRGDEYS